MRDALVLAAVLATAAVVLSGCGSLRIHRPRDLANAQEAQGRFRAAELPQAVAAERERLDRVLARELELVRQHTLARRDARLLYVLGEGDTREAWDFLGDDLQERLRELGVPPGQLEDYLRRGAQAEELAEQLEQTAAFYAVERQQDPSLPALRCPLPADVEPPRSGSARLFWDDYARQCAHLVEARRGRADGRRLPLDRPLANGAAIQRMEAAKQAAANATRGAREELAAARQAHARAAAGGEADRSAVRAAARRLIERAAQVQRAVDAFVQGDEGAALRQLGLGELADQLDKAREELASLPVDLSLVVGDLDAVPAVARLEAVREELVAGFTETLQGESASKVFASLEALGVAFQDPGEAPLTAMVLREKQLDLDVAEAGKREAFYDRTLALLQDQEAAYREELAYLGQAELRRRELEQEGCLEPAAAAAAAAAGEGSDAPPPPSEPPVHEQLSTDRGARAAHCRELVFRLLTHYSAAWTLGRVRSEQIDYRLIALHHESALDTSEIAFRRWQALLGLPIDQLVALHQTGIKPEEIVPVVVEALGLGAIAVGVN